ncbi:hypothetical protein ES705_26858 [subsurface metagenome]
MSRIYKIQRQGSSYYLCLPSFLITEEMLKNGVITDVLSYDQKEIFMVVSVAGKHNQNHQNNRKNTSEPRLANSIRKTD